jgi:hypothetical protein
VVRLARITALSEQRLPTTARNQGGVFERAQSALESRPIVAYQSNRVPYLFFFSLVLPAAALECVAEDEI